MKATGLALPDLHIRVLYFGSRNMHAVDRVTAAAPSWTLHWSRTGTASIEYKGAKHRVGPDKVALLSPYVQAHEIMAEGEEHTYVHFTLGPEQDRVGPSLFVLPVKGHVRLLLNQVTAAYRQKDRLSRADVMHVHALLDLLLAELPESVWPRPIRDQRIRHVLHHLDQHAGTVLTNNVLAKLAGMSTNAFIRLFSQEVDESPQRFVQRVRISKAALLLAQSDFSIEQIAERCGFCDRNYFSSVFRRIYGLGPATYRKQGRGH